MPALFKLGKEKFSIPSSWDEVSTELFFKLAKSDKKDYIAMLSILSGVEYKKIAQARELNLDEVLAPHLAWTNDKIDWENMPIPTEINVRLKTLKVPTNLELESFGQKIVLEDKLRECMTGSKGDVNLPELIPYAFSVYFCGKYYEKDFSKVLLNQFLHLVKDMPIMTVYPIGSFFLKRYVGFGNLMRSDLKPKGIWMKLRQGFKTLISLGTSKQSTHSQMETS